MGRLLAIVFLTVLPWTTASAVAAQLTAEERFAFVQRATEWFEAIQREDDSAIIDLLPPSFIKASAEDSGNTPDDLRKALVKELKKVRKDQPAKPFYDVDLFNVTFTEGAGTPPFALIPVSSKVVDKKRRQTVTMRFHGLGVREDGKWYLISLRDAEGVGTVVKYIPWLTREMVPSATFSFESHPLERGRSQ